MKTILYRGYFRNDNSCKEEALTDEATCFSFSATTMRPQSHARLQMKVVNLPCLIFTALTKDCAPVIYWNNTAHKLNKLLLATVQRQLQRSTKREASISHFNSVRKGNWLNSNHYSFDFHFILASCNTLWQTSCSPSYSRAAGLSKQNH